MILYEQIFDIQTGPALPSGIVMEEKANAYWLAFKFGNQTFKAWGKVAGATIPFAETVPQALRRNRPARYPPRLP